MIGKAVIKNCKRKKANLNMDWVDFREAYEMVSHAWMIRGLQLVAPALNVIALTKSTMIDWKIELVSGDISLGDTNINVGIFQGDFSLISLTLVMRRMKQGYSFQKGKSKMNHFLVKHGLKLYGSNQNEIDSLVRTVKIVRKDIDLTFAIDKYGILVIKRGREVECDRIELGNGEEIGQVGE